MTLYRLVFFNFLLFIAIVEFIYLQTARCSCLEINNGKGKTGGFLLLVFTVLSMGLLPVPWNTGADRELYAWIFLHGSWDADSMRANDWLFYLYTYVLNNVVDVMGYFVITAIIYAGNHLLAAKKLAPNNQFILFLLFIQAFFFYTYGTNTIRAGFAASFILLAIACIDRLPLMLLFLFVGVNCHFSMVIPALAILLARYYTNVRLFIRLWFLSVAVSAISGHFFEGIFASFVNDDRTSYLMVESNETHYKMGFRWDFILYSSVPILMGYYYIVKQKIKDEMYIRILSVYILTNIFWVLVIRANFSDRFLYLSCFIYPLVIAYPLLKGYRIPDANKKLAWIVLLSALFTYFV